MKIEIPRPFAIAIDDMGWMNGHNEGWQGKGPYRIGVKKTPDLADYEAVTDLAKKAGVRLQGLFILGELDRDDTARKYPTILPPLPYWRNQKSDRQLQVMDFVKKNAAHLEFGLHGVGHEYWPDDTADFKRAEWYNLVDREPWPEHSLRQHLDCFKEIMAQYDLDAAHGQSFPQSFVPCAYSYYWNPYPVENEYSLGAMLAEYGVRYANTDFTSIPELNPPVDAGFDQGVHVMNRLNYGNLWYMVGKLPTIPVRYQNTNFIETHWPNLLAQDTFLQEKLTNNWVDYYLQVNALPDRYCSKNTAQHHSQFLYKKYTKIIRDGNRYRIDNTQMPTGADYDAVLQNLVLKIPIAGEEHISQIKLNGKSVPAYQKINNFAYLYLPPLSRKNHMLEFSKGNILPRDTVLHTTTSNILDTKKTTTHIKVEGIFYGDQTLQFISEENIEKVTSNNSLLQILDWRKTKDGVQIDFAATDIQGVQAHIIMSIE